MKCDCHIHIILDSVYFKDAIDQHVEGVQEPLVRQRLADYAAAGVSYLRDGGDASGVALCARRLAPEYGIEYAAPAFPIHKNGRYGGFIGKGYTTKDEYISLLDEAEAKKADFIKLMLSGIMDFDRYGVLSCDALEAGEMQELIGLAHGRGLSVMAHVNGDEAVRDALTAGVDSIEHGYYISPETVKILTDSGAVWTPTLAPVMNLVGKGRFSDGVLIKIAEGQLRAVSDAAAGGAYIALGSDAGAWQVPHVGGVGDELKYLQLALGSGTEIALALGGSVIKEKFRRRYNG